MLPSHTIPYSACLFSAGRPWPAYARVGRFDYLQPPNFSVAPCRLALAREGRVHLIPAVFTEVPVCVMPNPHAALEAVHGCTNRSNQIVLHCVRSAGFR